MLQVARACAPPRRLATNSVYGDEHSSLHDKERLLADFCLRTNVRPDKQRTRPYKPRRGQNQEELTDPKTVSRHIQAQRHALLTPLMSYVLYNASSRYGLAIDSIRNVIKAFKGWVKRGLASKLDAAVLGSDLSEEQKRDILHKVKTQPPGIVLELLVLSVLEDQYKKGLLSIYSRAGGAGELILFMDVLKAAAVKLRPQGRIRLNKGEVLGADNTVPDAIILPYFYTLDEAYHFANAWGSSSKAPIVVNPIDPSHNCTKHCKMDERCWTVLADEAQALFDVL